MACILIFMSYNHSRKLLFSILGNIHEVVKTRLSIVNNNLVNIPRNK